MDDFVEPFDVLFVLNRADLNIIIRVISTAGAVNLNDYLAGNIADLENPHMYSHGPSGAYYPDYYIQVGPSSLRHS